MASVGRSSPIVCTNDLYIQIMGRQAVLTPTENNSPNRLDLIETIVSRVDKAHSARARSVGYFHFIFIDFLDAK